MNNLRNKTWRIILIAISCLLCGISFAYAANANVAGFWTIDYPSVPVLQTHYQITKIYDDGHQEYREGNQPINFPLPGLYIIQSPDGTLSGSNNDISVPGCDISIKLSGKIISDNVTLSLTYTQRNYSSGFFDISYTIVINFNGKVSGNVVTGTIDGSLNGSGETRYTNFTEYENFNGAISPTPFSATIGAFSSVDTFIVSGPPITTTSRNITFTYTGTSQNGIAGYYYQLDNGVKVYTTKTTVTFTNLSLGQHTFSVAAKDAKGNIDSTPAVWVFKIELKPSPNPPADSTLGKSNGEVGDPINVATGNMYVSTFDIALPGKGLNFDFTRTYNSRDDYAGPLGFGWTHSYNVYLTQDPLNKQIKIKDGQGKGYLFADDENGGYVSQRGEYSTLSNDKTGFIWTKKDATKFYFNTAGKLTKIVDRNPNTITLTYNKLNQLEKITDTAKRLITFKYDSQNRIVSVINPAGKSYQYAYDSNNNLIKVTDPKANNIAYTYDANQNLTQKTDPNNNSVYFTYDSSDRCTSSSRENNYEKITLSFEPASSRTVLTNSKGDKTTYYYNADLLLTRIIDSQGQQETSDWDTNLNLISRTDELGRTTSMEYDSSGNLTKLTDPQSSITQFSYETVFNNLTGIIDALGQVTSYYYDTKGNLTKVIDPLGIPSYYLYNKAGQVTNAVNAYNKRIYYAYDKYGNLSSIKDAASVTVKFAYDIMGNKIQSYDPKGNLTQYLYDELNRLIKTIYPNNASAVFSYDAMDNRISATDALLNTTYYSYDPAGKIKTITNALGKTVNYAYDTEGNLISIKDQNNNQTRLEYDSLNRLIIKIDALNYKWQYFYDACGNRIKEIDPKGQTTYHYYDELNRLERLISPDSDVRFTYDVLARRTAMSDWQGTTYYTYDPVGRLTKIDGPASADTIEYTYDLVGNRISMLDPDNKITQYSYDASNRISAITDAKGLITKYAYDKYGNLASVSYPNNTQAVYTYDILNRLEKLTNQSSVKPYAKLSEFSYTYDSLNRKTKATTLDATIEYSYDALSQLTQEKRTSSNGSYQFDYTYDSAGNRTVMQRNSVTSSTTNFTYNSLNQLNRESTGLQTVDYSYDPNGNLIRTSQDGGNNKDFSYDSLNRLLRVRAASLDESYKYNGEGRRVQQANGLTGEQVDYLYDGLSPIIERNSQGTTINSYIRNPNALGGIGGILEGLTPQGSVPEVYYLYDGLGSVANLTNASGVITQSYTYDAFGNTQGLSPQGTVPAFLTKELDKSGLIYFGARYYDPRIGRFITRDPLGMVDGPNLYLYCDSVGKPTGGVDLNLYVYAHNNPVNFVDPYGLWYIDINITGGYGIGGTVGIIIGSEGVYTYEGPAATSPGVGGAIMWSPQNPTTGWNVAVQGMLIGSYQRGYSFGKNGGWFSEYGLGVAYPTLWNLSGTGYYVHDPWKWPWRRDWWPWKKDKKESKK